VPGTDPDTPERLEPARATAVHRIWVEQAASHGATMADLDHVLCPNGTSDPSIRPDGAHFFTAGADRTAPLVMDSVRAAIAAAKGASVVGPYAP
jgi:hypothetical protein